MHRHVIAISSIRIAKVTWFESKQRRRRACCTLEFHILPLLAGDAQRRWTSIISLFEPDSDASTKGDTRQAVPGAVEHVESCDGCASLCR